MCNTAKRAAPPAPASPPWHLQRFAPTTTESAQATPAPERSQPKRPRRAVTCTSGGPPSRSSVGSVHTLRSEADGAGGPLTRSFCTRSSSESGSAPLLLHGRAARSGSSRPTAAAVPHQKCRRGRGGASAGPGACSSAVPAARRSPLVPSDHVVEAPVGSRSASEAVAQIMRRRRRRSALGASLVSDPSCSVVSPPERTFQASPLAIWWRWSLVRLLVIISNRHSVRTAPRPRRRNRVTPLFVANMAEHRLDHLCAFSVQTLAHLRLEHVSHPGVTTAGPALRCLLARPDTSPTSTVRRRLSRCSPRTSSTAASADSSD